MSRKLISGLLLLLSLPACSLLPTTNQPLKLSLLAPSEGLGDKLIKQSISLQTKDISNQFLVIMRLSDKQIKLNALLASGQVLLSLHYDGQSFQQNSSSPLPLPGEEILAFIQFALWPNSAVTKAYTANKGWQLELTASQRHLSTHQGRYLSVRYLSPNTMQVIHLRHHYQVFITTLGETTP